MRKSDKTTQRATALTLAAALAVAVYLNWEYAKVDTSDFTEDSITVSASVSQVSGDDVVMTDGIADGLLTDQEALEAADKTYGEAQLVSVLADTGTEFFEEARLNRTKTRDEVLEYIQESLQDASLSDEDVAALTQELSVCLNNITLENEIETLVIAKGLADCICFLDDGTAHITVMTSGSTLEATQVAQIRDIVLSKYDIDASGITVVEVK
ncbi:MAG: SpoIIIAH-like family protein [Faecalibacterium sp.]